MNKKFASIIIFASLFCLTSLASAQSITNPLTGVNNFSDLLTKIATGVGDLIVVLATIMIIISAILFLTSAGSPEKINTAKAAFMYAIIGIVVGLAANVIVEIIKNIIGA